MCVSELNRLLQEITSKLPNVSQKKMFGCECFFVNANIFAMVWKEGRIGVKLPLSSSHEEAMELEGAEAWSPNGLGTKKWVLLPTAMLRDAEQLRSWTTRAHQECSASVRKKTTSRKH